MRGRRAGGAGNSASRPGTSGAGGWGTGTSRSTAPANDAGTARATGTEEQVARAALGACNYRVKVAIVMLLLKLDASAAEARLTTARGDVRTAVANQSSPS